MNILDLADAVAIHLSAANLASAPEITSVFEVENHQPRYPTINIAPQGEEARPSTSIDHINQALNQSIDAFITIRLDNTRRGGGGRIAEVDVIRSEMRAALLGWQPDDYREQFQFARGRLQAIYAKEGLVTWLDTYTIRTWLTY